MRNIGGLPRPMINVFYAFRKKCVTCCYWVKCFINIKLEKSVVQIFFTFLIFFFFSIIEGEVMKSTAAMIDLFISLSVLSVFVSFTLKFYH